MERVRKLGYAITEGEENAKSCYVNDTFVYDSDVDSPKRTFNGIASIEEEEEGTPEKDLPCMCGDEVDNEGPAVISGVNWNEFDGINSTPWRNNANHEDNDNNNNSISKAINNKTENLDNIINLESKMKDENKIVNPPPENAPDRRDTPCATRSKMRRAISETKNPMEVSNLNRKMQQIEANSNCIKEIRETDETRTDEWKPGVWEVAKSDEKMADTEKQKTTHKRWFRKLSRYSTVDEQDMYFSNKGTKPMKRSQSMQHFCDEDRSRSEKDPCIQCQTHSESPMRKFSRGKAIKQSVSQGLSKFKQFSLRNRKYEQNYAVIDNVDVAHETSKKLRHPLKKQDTMPEIFEVPNDEKIAGTPDNMRKCLSVPDLVDSSSEYDEELSDLYLPRRMAICPDLPVPAMKQLRTYLVLTRLKQYCIV